MPTSVLAGDANSACGLPERPGLRGGGAGRDAPATGDRGHLGQTLPVDHSVRRLLFSVRLAKMFV